jgi:hypothetical protein
MKINIGKIKVRGFDKDIEKVLIILYFFTGITEITFQMYMDIYFNIL